MNAEIRQLNSSDLPRLLELLNRDLETHLFIASKANDILSQRINSSIIGYFEYGDLHSGILVGPNIVPFFVDENSADFFATFLTKFPKRSASIVGPKKDVSLLWSKVSNLFPEPRLVRETQILFSLTHELPLHPQSHIRFATIDDLDAYTSASIEMFTGEVGLAPFDLVEYRLRVKGQIESGNAYGWFADDGRVLFKVDVGAEFNGACQLQGVWLHPDLRGKDYSAALLQMAINKMQSGGLKTICLYVNDFNLPAVSLYRKLGFTEHNLFQTIFF